MRKLGSVHSAVFIECSRHRAAGEGQTPVPGRDSQAGKADLSEWARCRIELRAQAPRLGWAGGEGASGELDSAGLGDPAWRGQYSRVPHASGPRVDPVELPGL